MSTGDAIRKTLPGRLAVIITEAFWYLTLLSVLFYIYVGFRLVNEGTSGEDIFFMLQNWSGALIFVPLSFMLKRLVKTVAWKSPFTSVNVRRLRWIGALLIIYGPVHVLTRWLGLVHFAGRHNFSDDHLPIWSRLPWESAVSVIFLGLLILVLTQVFKAGLILKQDNDLTI